MTMDAIGLLKEDHRNVKKLLGQLEKMKAPGRRQLLLGQIEAEIKIHSKIEEEIFYPAYRDAVKKQEDRKLFFEAHEEHHVVDHVLDDLKESSPDGHVFAAKAKVLKELVEHHIEEEEGQMFKKAKKSLDKQELVDLGIRMFDLRQEMRQQITDMKGASMARTSAEVAFRVKRKE
jgi:hemerythrin-like domain-containing protein